MVEFPSLQASSTAARQQIEQNRQNGKNDGAITRQSFQFIVNGTTFTLSEKSFGTAGYAAQTLRISLLENNQENESDADQNIQNGQNDNQRLHKSNLQTFVT